MACSDVSVRDAVPLADLATLRVGGPARRLIELADADEIVEVVRKTDTDREPLLVLAGGSNVVIGDHGFDGVVAHVISRGVRQQRNGRCVLVTACAGEPWDELVAQCVENGHAGVECLSGIPGSTGATPIQNVGAYGQEVAQRIASVRVYDRAVREVGDLTPAACRFAYRSSALRNTDRYVVLAVTFRLDCSPLGRPLRYEPLAGELGVKVGARPPLAVIREAVIGLRARSGMVLDPEDPDSISVGSFFVNPILTSDQSRALERRVTDEFGIDATTMPRWPDSDGHVKVSAAWLIERAGFERGYRRGRAGISSKHALALVNRGGASAGEIVALAREIRDGVRATFGVTLRPEPTLIGIDL